MQNCVPSAERPGTPPWGPGALQWPLNAVGCLLPLVICLEETETFLKVPVVYKSSLTAHNILIGQ